MSVLTGIRGDDNVWEFDITVPVDPAQDKIWFTAKRELADADTDAVIRKGLNTGTTPSPVGISVTDAAAGKFEVRVLPADTDGLTDKALVFDVQFFDASTTVTTTVDSGIIRLTGEVTET